VWVAFSIPSGPLSLVNSLYVRNGELHRDLGMNYVSEEIRKFVRSHEERQHEDFEAIQLLDKTNQRRLF
jgi:hypothetical protein